MNKENEKIEEIISLALSFLEEGKTPSEIFDLLPNYRKELEEFFKVIDFIEKEKEKIQPDKEVLKKIILQVPPSVTDKNLSRSSSREVQGRSSWFTISNKILNPTSMNWKVILPVGIIAVIVLVLVGINQFSPKSSQIPSIVNNQSSLENKENLPVISQNLSSVTPQSVTGNSDDVANAILAEISDDEMYFNDTTQDSQLVAVDDQLINDFSQTYYENEF